MIRFVRGILRDVEEDCITVEAGGIGYGIHVPASLLGELPPIGEEVRVYTYMAVKEDAMTLYGFLYKEDRRMFVELLAVNGIGPKGALGILSVLKPDALRLAIVSGDAKAIAKAPGVGAKTAQRLILELRDKIDAESVFGAMLDGGSADTQAEAAETAYGAQREAIDALCALGYSRMEATGAVRKVELTADMSADEILKKSLRHLSFL